jgi:hypothetical protein
MNELISERRRGRRIACSVEATCETLEGTPPSLISCPTTILNLSRFGASLTISRKVQQGSTLFLKLPDPRRVFWCGRSARAVRATALFTNLLVGCEFTAPLTDGEFHILLGHTPAPERRMKPRFVPSPETLDHLVVRLVTHDLPVTLRDISVSGVCFAANRELPTGRPLQVQLANAVTDTHCILSCRLVHSRQVGAKWILGAAFLENITDEELLSLLS